MPVGYLTEVREYMSNGLVSVRPEADLDVVLRVLRERDISCVPVVGEAGDLAGILSITDLYRVARLEPTTLGVPPRLLAPERTAADVMTIPVCCVGEEEPIGEAARRMIDRAVHRLVVTRGGKPIGVISARDLMRAVAFHHVEHPLRSIMTTPVHSVDLGDSIEVALDRLDAHDVHGLAVIEGGRPVAVFTRAEAVTAAALPRELRRSPVEEVASFRVVCLEGSTPLYRAAARAMATRARRLLVLERGQLAGIVSGLDMARVVACGEV